MSSLCIKCFNFAEFEEEIESQPYLDASFKEEMEEKMKSSKYMKMLSSRKRLPAYKQRQVKVSVIFNIKKLTAYQK